MVKVTLSGKVLAEADLDKTYTVEGNYYFPPEALTKDAGIKFSESDTSSVCFWKGTAHYYNVTTGGETIPDVAWFYPEINPTKEIAPDRRALADSIKGYVAFYKNKVVIDE